MKPFHFGPSRDLFGCFHPAADQPAGAAAVVMCNPLFGESVQQHRLYNRMAQRLADLRIPALRFDWYGTGDSAGDLEDASLERWREDLAAAMAWLRRQARLTRVVLVGSRLGAALAAEVGRQDADVIAMALWEPVVDGAEYLADLHSQHEKGLGRYLAGTPKRPGFTELLGFNPPDGLLAEISRLRWEAAAPRADQQLLIVGSDASLEAARSQLDAVTPHARLHSAVFPPGWLQPEEAIYDVLVPVAPLRATTDWIARLAA